MKKIFCLGLLSFLMHVAQAQTTAAPVSASAITNKNDDTMLLTPTGTPEASWRRLAEVLVRRGYSIAYSDKELFTLSTHGLIRFGMRGPLRVTGMAMNDALIVRLYWGGSADTGGGEPAPARRRYSEPWSELEAIGRDFGGPVHYTTTIPN